VINTIIPTPFSCDGANLRREEAGFALSRLIGVDEKKETEKNVTDVVAGYTNPHDGWESYQVKDLIRTENEKWIFGLADWKSFISLTFRDEKTPDVANSLFKWFIRQNNEHAFGKHYTQKVGHSYFSYVYGLEYQTRDVVHFHALVDKPLDFSFVHRTWGSRCGFVWIDGNIKSKAKAVNYVCKYCVKGGQIDAYVAKNRYSPTVLPEWWHTTAQISSRIVQGRLFALDDLLKVLDDEVKN